MKRLIICDTLYQIIIAIQMKLTIFKSDDVDVVITNHSNGSKGVCDRLGKTGLFNKTIFIENKKISYTSNVFKSMYNAFYFGILNNHMIEVDNYDEIVFYGLDLFIYTIYNQYKKRKHHMVWSRYEEGLFSYETDNSVGKSVKFVEKVKKIFGNNTITDSIRNYYCFFPEFKRIKYDWEFIKVPNLENNIKDIRQILIDVFDYKKTNINEKYIYFSSSSDIDGHSYGETDLIIQLSNLLGKDNLIVKKHPRDDRNVYSNIGIHEMKSDGIPWEVIQLCNDFKDKILLTVDSGSFISVTSIFPQNVKGYFLFDIVDSDEVSFRNRKDNIKIMLKDLNEKGYCKNIKIIKCREEIFNEKYEEKTYY